MAVSQAYRFALDPSPAQERCLRSHAGAARFAWNWGLARCKERYEATGAIRCAGRTVTLPRLGAIRTYESTRKLARRVENGTARIVSATVSRTAQRWFVSFTVVVDRAIAPRHPWPGSAIGVDLGVRTLVTGVDDRGSVIEICGPKPLSSSLRRLRRASRAHSHTQDGSENRRKSAGRLARIHARVAYVRADALHKAASELSVRYETVVAEDLNVAGMTRNRRLARAVADQGFGHARRMLAYKTVWNGGRLILADRWYPSSKLCSGCGAVKAKLALSERVFTCEACGLCTDRDVNAARNLLDLAASGAESINACGGTMKTQHRRARPGEPGTRHRARGSDRDRQWATAGGGTCERSCSLSRHGTTTAGRTPSTGATTWIRSWLGPLARPGQCRPGLASRPGSRNPQP